MFPKLIEAKPQTNYRIELLFEDGTQGVADVSHLAGRGVFQEWESDGLFFKATIDAETNALVWNEMLDLDPFNLYLQLKGWTFEQWKSMKNQSNLAYATN